jgi:hypothetical protein
MACNFSPNQTVAIIGNTTFTYSQFTDSIARNATCGGTTYIRPDVGGSLLPWLYAIILLLIHLPTVIIRATRWEKVQVLSLALAAFAVAVSIQGYVSTKLKPEGVLVWMPLMLPLDAGAMLQLMVLIVEEETIRGLWDALRGQGGTLSGMLTSACFHKGHLKAKLMTEEAFDMERLQRDTIQGHVYQPVLSPKDAVYASTTALRLPSPQRKSYLPPRTPSEVRGKAFIVLGAMLLFIAITILEITGAVYASKGRAQIPTRTVAWCSPIFQPFAMAVQSGCDFLPTAQDATKGIGCVGLPAKIQRDWLEGISVLVPVALVLQGIDLVVLTLVHGKGKWRAIKMQRPWFTVCLHPPIFLRLDSS